MRPTAVLARLVIALATSAGPATATAAGKAPGPLPPPAEAPAEEAVSPPMPALSPSQPYRPLNFYNREELKAFPRELVPYVPPWCAGAYVAPPLPKLEGDENGLDSPVYVAADAMQLDETGESQVEGRVEVRQGLHLMHADRAVITGGRDRLLLEGHVMLQDPAMTLEASRAELTLDGSGSHLVDTEYALHEAHIRGRADAITRENLYRVSIEGGAWTTCEPGHDTWYLASREIRLDQEAGWGSARDVRLLIENVPTLWIPYITFPIDKRRRTGVLYPTLAVTETNGIDIGMPYYVNLDPQYDLLVTPRLIEKRGLLAEAKLRYLHGSPSDSVGRGALEVGVIGRDAAFGNRARSIVHFTHAGEPDPRWQLYADATKVSDDDYLDDLASRLSVNRETHLVRVLQSRNAFGFGDGLADGESLLRVQSWQTIDPTILPTDEPYRRLPQLAASLRAPGDTGLRWTVDAEFVAFARDALTAPLPNPVGTRLRLEPAVRVPVEGAFWRLEPAARARLAAYALDDNPANTKPSRAVPSASLDGTLFLERRLALGGSDWTQTLEPRAFLLWTPREDQDDTPLFDTTALTFSYDQLFRDNRFAGGDRVGEAQQVSLALESRLLAGSGEERARFGVGQALYAADRRVQLTPATPAETDSRSPLVAHAAWRVSDQWRARAESQWDARDGDIVRGSLGVQWQDARFRTLNTSYRYDKPDIDQSELSGLYPVDEHWNLVGRWLYDLDRSHTLEALGGAEYESCCWRARVLARRTVDINSTTATLVPDEGIVFEIELKGLGSLGDQVSNELAATIPGYENRKNSLR